MKLSQIASFLESMAPKAYQEDYDNSGLLIGDYDSDITKALVSLDLSDEVLNEAIEKRCNLIISHHPIIFKGLKKLTGQNTTEKLILKSIKHDINIYAIHTNLDNIEMGVNKILSDKIGLTQTRILTPKKNILNKLVTFCPTDHAEKIRKALSNAGAGKIGNYDFCSFNASGFGTFRGSEKANPFVGEKGEIHHEEEIRIEVIFPNHLENQIISNLISSHPYEEVAYDIYPLKNIYKSVGAGMIGKLNSSMPATAFLNDIKKKLNLKCLRHNTILPKPIQNIAICGGSGSFLIQDALHAGADIFLTGDLKYHDFQQGERQMMIADIGHYESEIFSKELIYSALIKKFPNFAVQISGAEVSPVNYL